MSGKVFNARVVVGTDHGDALVGLIIDDETDTMVGTLDDSPAAKIIAELGWAWVEEKTGMPYGIADTRDATAKASKAR